ncbi:MAG TPA: hypothetical protein VG870_08340 [Chitinophagaceae bacterium]|nr:hypothetical protein [Chitinophagaceae bacterium]
MRESWINRIRDHSVQPPDRVWEEVSSALTGAAEPSGLARRLRELEEAPPTDAWKKIQARLDQSAGLPAEHPRPTVPAQPGARPGEAPGVRIIRFRYLAAAALIGLAVLGWLRWEKHTAGLDSQAESYTAKADSPVQKTPGSLHDRKPVPSSPVTTEPYRPDATEEADLEASKHSYARLDLPLRRAAVERAGISLYSLPAPLSSSISVTGTPDQSFELQYPHRAAVSDPSSRTPADRYVMFQDADGRFIRMSRKLADLLCCVTGEQTTESCSSQLKKWRTEIASSSFVPSPDNFMDILDLVNSLQEGQP